MTPEAPEERPEMTPEARRQRTWIIVVMAGFIGINLVWLLILLVP